ncbi:unnamed protein product [Phytomonas sp. Hart1]|nr:unnamed protein product [Phytomonas sp. Hart1]|eukprot:CCW66718.1 unnamed protein product [Phytomonas sp. isolate Hart1]
MHVGSNNLCDGWPNRVGASALALLVSLSYSLILSCGRSSGDNSDIATDIDTTEDSDGDDAVSLGLQDVPEIRESGAAVEA